MRLNCTLTLLIKSARFIAFPVFENYSMFYFDWQAPDSGPKKTLAFAAANHYTAKRIQRDLGSGL
jgi:hypothetical protein